MEFRTASLEDAASLVIFNQAMAMETEGKQLDPETLKKGVESVFDDVKKGFYVVAEDDGAIVGGLMVTYEWSDWRNRWFWWIQSVYILPNFRAKGIYRGLYEHIVKKASEEEDVCGIRLYVEKENFQAQKVYEKTGMEISHYLMFESAID